MKDEEKKLIENLFHRLKNTELNSSEKDNEANSLIQDLVKKQPYSSYYMTQTILIQETAIKKLSLKVEELTNKISNLNLKVKYLIALKFSIYFLCKIILITTYFI